RGRAHVQRDARAHPPDREPVVEEAAEPRRGAEASGCGIRRAAPPPHPDHPTLKARSSVAVVRGVAVDPPVTYFCEGRDLGLELRAVVEPAAPGCPRDRKSTRLNSSHAN